jgi:hypothetical protein
LWLPGERERVPAEAFKAEPMSWATAMAPNEANKQQMAEGWPDVIEEE